MQNLQNKISLERKTVALPLQKIQVKLETDHKNKALPVESAKKSFVFTKK